MNSSLRTRSAVVAVLGILLIPLATSNLRGLTHVLSCSTDLSAGFDAPLPQQGEEPEVVLLEPTAVTRGADGEEPVATTAMPATTTTSTTTTAPAPADPKPVCGGIVVDIRLSTPTAGIVQVDIPVTNSGRYDWRGTIKLRVGDKEFPVDLGSIPPGQTRTRSVAVEVDKRVTRVAGELLLGA